MIEHRYSELRHDANGLSGVAMRYGEVAQVGGFREKFVAGAFDYADAVLLNVMHDRSRIIARNNGTLDLRDGSDALEIAARPVDTADGRDGITMVRAGLLTGLSIEFRADDESFENDLRTVKRATLFGVALVDRPAYKDAEVQLAKRLDDWRKRNHRRLWL